MNYSKTHNEKSGEWRYDLEDETSWIVVKPDAKNAWEIYRILDGEGEIRERVRRCRTGSECLDWILS